MSQAGAERRALREICNRGDIVETTLEGAFLVIPVTNELLDALAAFEAELEDPEDGAEAEEEPLETDLGATHDMNQERASKVQGNPDGTLEFDGDGVADPDREDDDPGGGNIEDEPQGDSAQEGGHFAGLRAFGHPSQMCTWKRSISRQGQPHYRKEAAISGASNCWQSRGVIAQDWRRTTFRSIHNIMRIVAGATP